jgi:hypothetical protein
MGPNIGMRFTTADIWLTNIVTRFSTTCNSLIADVKAVDVKLFAAPATFAIVLCTAARALDIEEPSIVSMPCSGTRSILNRPVILHKK